MPHQCEVTWTTQQDPTQPGNQGNYCFPPSIVITSRAPFLSSFSLQLQPHLAKHPLFFFLFLLTSYFFRLSETQGGTNLEKMASYAAVAASGPKQTPEEVRNSCRTLYKCNETLTEELAVG